MQADADRICALWSKFCIAVHDKHQCKYTRIEAHIDVLGHGIHRLPRYLHTCQCEKHCDARVVRIGYKLYRSVDAFARWLETIPGYFTWQQTKRRYATYMHDVTMRYNHVCVTDDGTTISFDFDGIDKGRLFAQLGMSEDFPDIRCYTPESDEEQ